MVQTLQAINPGSLRFMNYLGLGTSDSGYGGDSGRIPGKSSPSATGTCDFLHGPAYCDGSGRTSTFAGFGSLPVQQMILTGSIRSLTLSDTMSDADLKSFRRQSLHAVTDDNFSSAWSKRATRLEQRRGPHWFGSQNVGALGYGGAWGRNF